MATLSLTGFDSGDTLDIVSTTGTASVQNTTVRSAGYALRCNPTTTATGSALIQGFANTGGGAAWSASVTYLRFYFRIATLPASANEEFFTIETSGVAVKISGRITSAGNIQLYSSTTLQLGSDGTTTLALNRWYRIEVKCGTGLANVIYELRVNGITELSGNGALLNTASGEARLGKVTDRNGQSVDFYYDDVLVSDTDFPGQGRIRVKIPVGIGAYDAFTSSSGGAKNTDVDEIPTNATDWVVTSGTSGQAQTFTLTSNANASINGQINTVKLFTAWRNHNPVTSAGNGTVRLRLRSGTTDLDTGADIATGNSYLGRQMLSDTDPNTGAAWTEAALDSVQGGGVEKVTGAATSRLSTVYLFVDFIPGVGAGAVTGKAIVGCSGKISVRGAANVTGKAIVGGNSKATLKATAAVIGRAVVGSNSKATLNAAAAVTAKAVVASSSKATLNAVAPVLARAVVSASSKISVSAAAATIGRAVVSANSKATLNAFASILGRAVVAADSKATLRATASVTGKAVVACAGKISVSGAAACIGRAVVACNSKATLRAIANVTGKAIVTCDGTVSSATGTTHIGQGTCIGKAIVGASAICLDIAAAQVTAKAVVSNSGVKQYVSGQASVIGRAVVASSAIALDRASATVTAKAIVGASGIALDIAAASCTAKAVVSCGSKLFTSGAATCTGKATVGCGTKITVRAAASAIGKAVVSSGSAIAVRGIATVTGKAVASCSSVVFKVGVCTVTVRAQVACGSRIATAGQATCIGRAIVSCNPGDTVVPEEIPFDFTIRRMQAFSASVTRLATFALER